MPALRVGVVTSPCAAWLLTLRNQWEQCHIRVNEHGAARYLTIVGAKDGIAAGTSGSPIEEPDRLNSVASPGSWKALGSMP